MINQNNFNKNIGLLGKRTRNQTQQTIGENQKQGKHKDILLASSSDNYRKT